MPKEGKSIKIMYGRGKRSTICYSEGFKVESNSVILKKEGLQNVDKETFRLWNLEGCSEKNVYLV